MVPCMEDWAGALTDDELMVRAQKGEAMAFDALVRRHQGRVLGMAWKQLGDQHLAQDVGQNTFVEVYRALDTYQPQGKFKGFLHRILFRQCALAGRRRTSRKESHVEEELVSMSDS